jgi:hypothetical protein
MKHLPLLHLLSGCGKICPVRAGRGLSVEVAGEVCNTLASNLRTSLLSCRSARFSLSSMTGTNLACQSQKEAFMPVSHHLSTDTHSSTRAFCYYVSTKHTGKFYAVCASCAVTHGPISGKTKTPIPFVSRKEAERVCTLLNEHGGIQC